jgi:chromosome segregation ATPase
MSSNKDKIIETAEKLEAQGVNPTQVTVREAMGGGSFATIGPILKEWKESKKEDHALAEIQVPNAITDKFEQLKGAVWQAAVDEAGGRLSAEREALRVAQEQAAAEVAVQRESVATLEAEADKFDEAIEGLIVDLDARTGQLNILQADFKQAKDQAETDRQAAASALAKEQGSLSAAIDRAERAEKLHEAVQAQARADLSDLRNEYKAEIVAFKKENEAAKSAANEQVKKSEAQAQEQALRAEKSEKETQLRAAGEQACQSHLEAAQREAEQMQRRVEKLEEKAEKAVQEAAELRGELRAVRASSAVADRKE